MLIRLTSEREEVAFLAGHLLRAPAGPSMRCSCGWSGQDWYVHRRRVLEAWLEERRLNLRARLLVEEGVDRP